MHRIPAIFREVDSGIFNQLEQAIQQTDAWRYSTCSQIRGARARAARLLKRRAERLRTRLQEVAQHQLEAERKVLQQELVRIREEKLEATYQEAQTVLSEVLNEILGDNSQLASRAALHRLALLFTLLSKKQGLSITFNPADISDPEIKSFCAERSISTTARPDCGPGDFLINLPSGIIESTLSDDIENLVHHFSNQRNGDSGQHV